MPGTRTPTARRGVTGSSARPVPSRSGDWQRGRSWPPSKPASRSVVAWDYGSSPSYTPTVLWSAVSWTSTIRRHGIACARDRPLDSPGPPPSRGRRSAAWRDRRSPSIRRTFRSRPRFARRRRTGSWRRRPGHVGSRSWRRSEEHTSELQSLAYLVCRLLLEKKKKEKLRRMNHIAKTRYGCYYSPICCLRGTEHVNEGYSPYQLQRRTCVDDIHAHLLR